MEKQRNNLLQGNQDAALTDQEDHEVSGPLVVRGHNHGDWGIVRERLQQQPEAPSAMESHQEQRRRACQEPSSAETMSTCFARVWGVRSPSRARAVRVQDRVAVGRFSGRHSPNALNAILGQRPIARGNAHQSPHLARMQWNKPTAIGLLALGAVLKAQNKKGKAHNQACPMSKQEQVMETTIPSVQEITELPPQNEEDEEVKYMSQQLEKIHM